MVNVRLLIACFIFAIVFRSTLILQSEYITEIGTCEREEEPSRVVSWARNLGVLDTPSPFSYGKKWLCEERTRVRTVENWVRPYVPIALHGVWTASLISFGLLLSPEVFAFLWLIVFILRCVGRFCHWLFIDGDADDESYESDSSGANLSSPLRTNAETETNVIALPEPKSTSIPRSLGKLCLWMLIGEDADEYYETNSSSEHSSGLLLTNVRNDPKVIASSESKVTEDDMTLSHPDETQTIASTLNTVSVQDSPHIHDDDAADKTLKTTDDASDLQNDPDESDDITGEITDRIVPSIDIDDHKNISPQVFHESNTVESDSLADNDGVECRSASTNWSDRTVLNTGNRSKYTQLDIQRAICRVEIAYLLFGPSWRDKGTSLTRPQCQADLEPEDDYFMPSTTPTAVDRSQDSDGNLQSLTHLPTLPKDNREQPATTDDATKQPLTYEGPTPSAVKNSSGHNTGGMIGPLARNEQNTAALVDSIPNSESDPIINVDTQLGIDVNEKDSLSKEDAEPCLRSSTNPFQVTDLIVPSEVMIHHESAEDTMLHGQSDDEVYSTAVTEQCAGRFASAVESLSKKVNQTAGITIEKRLSMMRLLKAIQHGTMASTKDPIRAESMAPITDSDKPDDKLTSGELFPEDSQKRIDSKAQIDPRRLIPPALNHSHRPLPGSCVNAGQTLTQLVPSQLHSGHVSLDQPPSTRFVDVLLPDNESNDDNEKEEKWRIDESPSENRPHDDSAYENNNSPPSSQSSGLSRSSLTSFNNITETDYYHQELSIQYVSHQYQERVYNFRSEELDSSDDESPRLNDDYIDSDRSAGAEFESSDKISDASSSSSVFSFDVQTPIADPGIHAKEGSILM